MVIDRCKIWPFYHAPDWEREFSSLKNRPRNDRSQYRSPMVDAAEAGPRECSCP